MAVNIMYYGMTSDSSASGIDVGPFSFTPEQVNIDILLIYKLNYDKYFIILDFDFLVINSSWFIQFHASQKAILVSCDHHAAKAGHNFK